MTLAIEMYSPFEPLRQVIRCRGRIGVSWVEFEKMSRSREGWEGLPDDSSDMAWKGRIYIDIGRFYLDFRQETPSLASQGLPIGRLD